MKSPLPSHHATSNHSVTVSQHLTSTNLFIHEQIRRSISIIFIHQHLRLDQRFQLRRVRIVSFALFLAYVTRIGRIHVQADSSDAVGPILHSRQGGGEVLTQTFLVNFFCLSLIDFLQMRQNQTETIAISELIKLN